MSEKMTRRERRQKRNENKKPFGETKVGKFLKGAGSTILDVVGDLTPAGSVLNTVASLIDNDKQLSEHDKEIAKRLLEMDIAEMNAISERWSADMASDSWLAKNIRPLVLGYLVFVTTLIVVLDSAYVLSVEEPWIDLLKYILGTVVLAYFGSRGGEKIVKHWQN